MKDTGYPSLPRTRGFGAASELVWVIRSWWKERVAERKTEGCKKLSYPRMTLAWRNLNIISSACLFVGQGKKQGQIILEPQDWLRLRLATYELKLVPAVNSNISLQHSRKDGTYY